MTPIEIGSVQAALQLGLVPGDGGLNSLNAELRDSGLVASKRIHPSYASGWRDLAVLFMDMAVDWRGWSGTRSWTSVESDLLIGATHDGGHIRLDVTMRADVDLAAWVVSTELVVEPGEQLTLIAEQLAAIDR